MATTLTARLDGTVSSLAAKAPVRVATTAAISLIGEQTIDGVAVVSGDRVLVKSQSSSADNGIYVANTSTWSRAKDWDGSFDAGDGSLVFVRAGSTNAGFLFKATAATTAIVVGTTAVTFVLALSFGTLGTTGALVAQAETEDEAQDAIGAGATGKVLFIAETDDAAIEALLDGATDEDSPTTAAEIPILTEGGDGRKATLDNLLAQLPLRGYLGGATLSRNATVTSLDIAAGVARDSTNVDFLNLASSITKSLNSGWAVGTAQGGLDTGSKANSTWYHVWLIKRIDTDVVDALFSTSATSPTMPADYTLKRRIGSIRTDGSGDILHFTQVGDEFIWSASVLDIDATNPGTSAVTRTLTVPTGVKVKAKINLLLTSSDSGTGTFCYLSEMDKTDEAPSVTALPLVSTSHVLSAATGVSLAGSQMDIRTNTSAQVRSRLTFSNANVSVKIATLGWEDARGRHD